MNRLDYPMSKYEDIRGIILGVTAGAEVEILPPSSHLAGKAVTKLTYPRSGRDALTVGVVGDAIVTDEGMAVEAKGSALFVSTEEVPPSTYWFQDTVLGVQVIHTRGEPLGESRPIWTNGALPLNEDAAPYQINRVMRDLQGVDPTFPPPEQIALAAELGLTTPR